MLISQVLGARAPEDMEMPHLDSVLDPIESHVNGSRSLLLSNVVGDVVGCQTIRGHHGGRFWGWPISSKIVRMHSPS